MAAFARGKYIIGDYIPAGSYIIKAKAEVALESGFIIVRKPYDEAEDSPSDLVHMVIPSFPYVGYLDLEEGDILESPAAFSLTIIDPTAVFK